MMPMSENKNKDMLVLANLIKKLKNSLKQA